MKNWLIFENQRDAYILDGVPKAQAIALAKKDCKNNPYDAYVENRYRETMRDLEIMEGKISRNSKNVRKKSHNLSYAVDDFTDTVIGRILVVIIFIAALYGIPILLYSAVAFGLWNLLVSPAFGIIKITFIQSLVFGFIFFILKTSLATHKK